MKHNLKPYIKSFAFIFFAMSTGFTKSPIDTIIDHHTQRRILVNTDIIGNKVSIKHESDAITDILTTTTVDIKRQASTQEKFDILRAVMGERIVARLTERESTGRFSAKTASNPYSAILKTLRPDNASLRNHYRVLELTYNWGDLQGKLTEYGAAIENIIAELTSLTGMSRQFFGDLVSSVGYEHHLITCSQSSDNIFELIPNLAQQNKIWLIPVVLNSVAEIKSHPLSGFATAYLNLTQENSPQTIPESLELLWGEDYSPYQFSAAKFLALWPERTSSKIGITVLWNIAKYSFATPGQYGIGIIRKLEKKKQVYKRLESMHNIEELDKEEIDKEEIEEILKATSDHPNKKDAKDFLSTTLWDYIANSDPKDKLLSHEIHLAKTIIHERIKSEIITKLARISMNEFLSLSEKSAHYDDISFRLFQCLLNNPETQNTPEKGKKGILHHARMMSSSVMDR